MNYIIPMKRFQITLLFQFKAPFAQSFSYSSTSVFAQPAGMIPGILSWSGPQFLLITQTAGMQFLKSSLSVRRCYPIIIACLRLLFVLSFFDSGSMEFVVPPADSSVFFPISVRFSATSTFSDLKVYFCSALYLKPDINYKPLNNHSYHFI